MKDGIPLEPEIDKIMRQFHFCVVTLTMLFFVFSCHSSLKKNAELELRDLQFLGVDSIDTPYGRIIYYDYQFEIRNNSNDIYVDTKDEKGNIYFPSVFSIVKKITPDSLNEAGTIIDGNAFLSKVKKNEKRLLSVRFEDDCLTHIYPDTIKLYFTYYLDSLYINQKRLEVLIPLE
ncbi:MAG: hypothetical protein R2828_27920 [Saprospiraceae bacterium]